MRSAIYEGTVRHRRVAEHEHAFTYKVAMQYVDLDEVDVLVGGRLTKPGLGVTRFRRSDFYGDPSVPLADAVRGLVRQRTGRSVEGPVRLLTHLRSLGHCFNPVSFYYCFAADGERLEALVAEVTNTPWGERHAYVLARPAAADDGDKTVLSGSFAKEFHVSPFMGMDQRYTWKVPVPGDSLFVHLESNEAAERVFDATLQLDRKPFDRKTLRRIALRYPAASRRMLLLIYVHALVLRLKGVKVKPHPGVAAP
ncbi:MAG: DUF1365 domain-containing protein [Actinobacteria bacterium]|nr:DUF1365 domain-containing protein [Actinomycetota bacterium]